MKHIAGVSNVFYSEIPKTLHQKYSCTLISRKLQPPPPPQKITNLLLANCNTKRVHWCLLVSHNYALF